MSDLDDGKLPFFIGRGVFIGAVVLVPWTLFLAATLPAQHLSRHYKLTWVGFDIFLVSLLILTAISILRQGSHHHLLACATGMMLLLDGWFDVTGAGNRADYVLAVVMALVFTVPSGIFLLVYAASSNHHLQHHQLDD